MKKLQLISVLAGVLWMAACSSGSEGDSSSAGSGGQATGGSAGLGGAALGGTSGVGGTASGGAPGTGGAPLGGEAGTGGVNTGGTSTGGAETGGAETGGASTGGTSSGGAETGGAETGGASTGGTSSGGAETGGAETGGAETGGAETGGGGSAGTGGTEEQHWVGTWTASPYYDGGNQPPSSLSNSVLRQVTHVSLGGDQLRVQFANCGNGPVTINSAHIALCMATPTVDSTIDTATDKALAFSGAESVTIGQGEEIWSDPIDFTVPALGNITITTAFGNVPSQVCGHSGARTTSYLKSGSSDVSAASITGATTFEHWYYISGIDVMAGTSARAAVAIGDSITDGRGVTTDGNNRWTDVLAARLHQNPDTANVAMLNQGIGATNLVGSFGTAAQARFDRDVLGQSAVRYAIVFDGVNDIAGNASAASLTNAYDDLISRAHNQGLLIYGGTITPFNGNSYYTTSHESVRQEVNAYIRSGAFDGVIDFDAALTDGGNPPSMKAEYAAWSQQDWLHPGPAGYQKMGEEADLTLFTE